MLKTLIAWDGFARWVLSIFEDSDGLMWIGTSSGLVEFNEKTGSYTLYKHDPNDPESLADNDVNSISQDLNGNLWISTNGVDLFSKHTKKFFIIGMIRGIQEVSAVIM